MPPKKKKPAKRAAKKLDEWSTPEEIRDHGEVVTAPSHFSQEDVVAKITGIDQVPSLDDLSKAKAPPFDPHEGREVEPGREFGDVPEPMVTTLVFMGIDRGGDFEDRVEQLVNAAERNGLLYITATVGKLDLDKHVGHVADVAEAVQTDEERDGEDGLYNPSLGDDPI
jgi:hypothetical protein